jgi:hypothetical protein
MPSPGQALAAGRRRPLGRALPGFGTQPHCASKIGGWLPSGSSPASHSFLSAGNATNQPQNTSASAIAPRSAPTALPLPLPALSTALREAVAGRTSKSLSESRSKSVLTLTVRPLCLVMSYIGKKFERHRLGLHAARSNQLPHNYKMAYSRYGSTSYRLPARPTL